MQTRLQIVQMEIMGRVDEVTGRAGEVTGHTGEVTGRADGDNGTCR